MFRIFLFQSKIVEVFFFFFLTASVHRNEICASSYVQTKLEEGMLPQCLFSLSCHLVLKKIGVLTEGTPRFLAHVSFLLKAYGSFGETLAAFSGVILLHSHSLFSATTCQRRFCAFKISTYTTLYHYRFWHSV